MRIARFKNKAGETRYGIIEGETIAMADGDPIRGLKRTGAGVPLADVRLLAPIDPVNVLCIGQNYKATRRGRRRKLPKAPSSS